MEDLRIMNAAGMCKTLEDVERFCATPVSEITLGSITPLPRLGNPGNTFWIDDTTGASLNSLGLPNPGLNWYRSEMYGISEMVRAAGKKLRVSVAGFSIEDYRALVEGLVDFDIDTLEINLSCPNVWNGGSQKSVFALDTELTRQICWQVCQVTPQRMALAIKIAPSDPALVRRLAWIIEESGRIDEVVAVNTAPNGFFLNGNGRPALDGNGFGGMGGRPLKLISLGHVRQFRSLLSDRILITGVGGIFEGNDVHDHIASGASGVQVGTACYAYGAKVFQDIALDFLDTNA